MTESLFVHSPGDSWEAERSLSVGDVLHLRLIRSGGYRWSAVASSDPHIATVVTEPSATADGNASATVSALQPGTATLTATTLHTGDRFGPPTRLWRMTLHIGEMS